MKSSDNNNNKLNQTFIDSLPVVDADGNILESKDYTQTESSVAPLKYSDGRLVKENDYVLHINYESGIPVDADFAQVWATLYYDNGQPIGVSLNKANDNKSPTISMFSVTDEQGHEKRYYKTAITIPQIDIGKRLIPLNEANDVIANPDEQWFQTRVTELSQQHGIASFAVYIWLKNAGRAEANEYLEKSARQNYRYAITLLEKNKKHEKNTYGEASIEILTQKAENGDESAQYNLAKAYMLGNEIEQNDKKALFWLEKVSHSNLQAYLDLGRYYRYGGFDWFRREKMLFSTSYFPSGKQAIKAFECFKSLSEKAWQGQIPARFQLAECYSYGIGVEADPAQGLKMYASIVNEGDIDADIEVIEALYRYSDYKIRQSDFHFERNETELAVELFEEGFKHLSICASHYSPAKYEISALLLEGRPQVEGKPQRLKQNRELAFNVLHGINLDELTVETQSEVKKLLANEKRIMAQPPVQNEHHIPSELKTDNTSAKSNEAVISKKVVFTIIFLLIVLIIYLLI